jgi:hypothetical protein
MKRASSSLLAIVGCAMLGATPSAAQYLPPTANLLLRYDTDQDGAVSRAEVDNGLRNDYALADEDGDGCIASQEIRDENDRRLTRDGGVASPIRDWNLDGCVNPNEFGSSVRSYFNFADRSRDGEVNITELRGPSMPITLPTPAGQQQTSGVQPAPQGVVSASPSILDPTSPDYYGR